ncbi:putative transcription factor C2H2 family [Rosa chinensis]|uniref:Putative transcription factor C2H2 family n=1 Tax=Rosa chinensis TaxID=74649 RepID=A0A2P6SBN6_ROSCH|nr:splicing factor SF3a60 homolog [Rosa chinensis]PRQ56090.1 putative transcription factor C2H2 family [Rosa chinensis]
MSSTLLEVTRGAHEEVERLERLIVKDLQNEPASGKERLAQSHRVRLMIDTVTSTTERLIEIYEDNDNARKDEIAALGGQTATGTNVFSAFYDRLKEIREYHRRHPAALVVDANEEHEALLKEEPQVEFSGEEAYGRYLDLHELYNQYINSKFGEPIEYSAYLDVFSQPHKIPRKLKSTRQYREYLENLVQYLVYFFHRTEPLQDLDRIFTKVETEFEEQWADGKVEEWENAIQDGEQVQDQQTVIDLDYFSTVEELVELGPEKLKEALASLGLKIGGTVQQRAERLLLTKDTPLEKLDKKHFAKGSHGSAQNGAAVAPQQVVMLKEIALLEAKLKKLSDLLSEAIERTKDNIVKKQALTYEEIAAEREDEETQADTESDDDEQQIYNPLKLPMGWDGKPIPYWLYKLHGLGQEFKCEICGNQSYWGRRAFERHFKEWRHQHGMRCLGIPNTKNFNEITSIEEAQELWKRIQARQGVNKWRPDLEEEYEDREGNIYNKKTYTDLQRQGLI